jgi:hypothetical protein
VRDSKWPEQILTWSPEERSKKKKKKTRDNFGKESAKSDEGE